jgi:NDP-hexose-3-ketoreductase
LIRLGIICPSEIAFRRFMPALISLPDIRFVGLAVCSFDERIESSPNQPAETIYHKINEQRKRASEFISAFGGKIFDSYAQIAASDEIDALYIPLPPALHYRWARLALENGKHVLLEKPSTTSLRDTKALVDIAKQQNLALYENYIFIHHEQLNVIRDYISQGRIGDVRLYRMFFGFPKRASDDFRYDKSLGGGALLDAGGYTIRLASLLLGDTAKIVHAQLNYTRDYSVDLYGCATVKNHDGICAQIAFGMDNEYQCDLEICGSEGILHTGRIFTPPPKFTPEMTLRKGNRTEVLQLPQDNSFQKSILYFMNSIKASKLREESYRSLLKQSEYIDCFMALAEDHSYHFRGNMQ